MQYTTEENDVACVAYTIRQSYNAREHGSAKIVEKFQRIIAACSTKFRKRLNSDLFSELLLNGPSQTFPTDIRSELPSVFLRAETVRVTKLEQVYVKNLFRLFCRPRRTIEKCCVTLDDEGYLGVSFYFPRISTALIDVDVNDFDAVSALKNVVNGIRAEYIRTIMKAFETELDVKTSDIYEDDPESLSGDEVLQSLPLDRIM
jgi:hypothetical protein